MSELKIDLTQRFRTQRKAITQLTNSIDTTYLVAEINELYDRISKDAKVDRVQEVYYMYLYGESFIKYLDFVKTIALSEIRKKGLSGFRLTYDKIGSQSELATYPTLTGIRVQISTVN